MHQLSHLVQSRKGSLAIRLFPHQPQMVVQDTIEIQHPALEVSPFDPTNERIDKPKGRLVINQVEQLRPEQPVPHLVRTRLSHLQPGLARAGHDSGQEAHEVGLPGRGDEAVILADVSTVSGDALAKRSQEGEGLFADRHHLLDHRLDVFDVSG